MLLYKGQKLIYKGNNSIHTEKNLNKSLKKGRIYTLNYAIGSNTNISLKEYPNEEYELDMFDDLNNYINNLLIEKKPEYIYMCQKNGTVLFKLKGIDSVSLYENRDLVFYDTDKYIGEIKSEIISSIMIDSYDDIVIYLKV